MNMSTGKYESYRKKVHEKEKKMENVFAGMVSENELVELADMNQEGGWEIVGSITAVATYLVCPSIPCTSTGYCK